MLRRPAGRLHLPSQVRHDTEYGRPDNLGNLIAMCVTCHKNTDLWERVVYRSAATRSPAVKTYRCLKYAIC